MSISRREALKGGLALAAGSVLPWGHGSAWAGSSMALGNAQIDVLSDGHLQLPVNFLFGDMPQDPLMAILEKYNMPQDMLTPDCNLTLVRDGERTILFDVGAGPNFQPSSGQLADALDALELDPSDVTHVVFTHAHPDHLWGLFDDFDELVFPEAEYMIGAVEFDYWMNPETINTIGDARQAFAAGAKRNLEAIEDRLTQFKMEEEVLPGVFAHPSIGHTPGHTSFEVRNGRESVMIIGDAIGNHHVAFEQPEWQAGSDQDQALGVQSRLRLLDQMATDKMRLIGFHMPYPGIGYAEKHDGRYRYVAA